MIGMSDPDAPQGDRKLYVVMDELNYVASQREGWDRVRHLSDHLAKAGASVLLIRPHSKLPDDRRSAAEKRNDAAKFGTEASGHYSSTTDRNRLSRYFDRAHEADPDNVPNIGINIGRSGLVVVDCDSAEEKAALQAAATDGTDRDPSSYTPTVTTPGSYDKDGNWVHKDGGHYYYLVDIDGFTLPETAGIKGASVGDGGSIGDVKVGGYVVAPPSERNTGQYTVSGPVRGLSSAPWLAELLSSRVRSPEAATETAERRTEARTATEDYTAPEGKMTYSEWAREPDNSWQMLAAEFGWVDPTPAGGTCGPYCTGWLIPGGSKENRRSLVTHEAGCNATQPEDGAWPVQFHTDRIPDALVEYGRQRGNPDQKRFTKLSAVVSLRYGGDWDRFYAEESVASPAAHDPWDLADARVDVADGTDPDLTPAEYDGATQVLSGVEYHIPWLEPDITTEEEMSGLWDADPRLRELYDLANSSLLGPYSLLGTLMARHGALVPPHVVLPVLGGQDASHGVGSLNMMFGIVGGSGVGKSESIARSAHLVGPEAVSLVPSADLATKQGVESAYVIRAASGQAHKFPHNYVRSRTFLAITDEVDSFTKEMDKDNSPAATVRSAVSGAALGGKVANSDRDRRVPSQSYRFMGIMGIQPSHSGPLLAGRTNGMPQRFLFLPAESYLPTDMTGDQILELVTSKARSGNGTPRWLDALRSLRAWEDDEDGPGYTFIDPSVRPSREVAEAVAAAEVADRDSGDGEEGSSVFRTPSPRPLYDLHPVFSAITEHRTVSVCERATKEAAMETYRRHVMLQAGIQPGVLDDLNSHRYFNQMKVAVLLSVTLGEDGNVTDAMWDMAAVLMRVHDRTVARMRRALEKDDKAKVIAAGRKDAVRESARAEASQKASAELENKVFDKVVALADGDGWAPWRGVRNGWTGETRKKVIDLVDLLVSDEALEEKSVKNPSNGKMTRFIRVVTD